MDLKSLKLIWLNIYGYQSERDCVPTFKILVVMPLGM